MSKRALANQERKMQMLRVNRLSRNLLILVATLLTFVTIGLLVADQMFRPDTFKISQLTIKGKFRHLSPNDVESALREQDLGNFFSVDLDQVKGKIEKLAWVQNVDVRREWPNALSLNVIEQRPVMRWGEKQWVTSTGQVIELPAGMKVSADITLFGNEQDASKLLRQAVLWKKQLNQSELTLKALALSGSQAWTVTLVDQRHDATFDVALGREQVTERLTRFQKLFNSQFKTADQRLIRVDARYPDGLAVRAEKYKPTESAEDGAVAVNN